MIVNNQKGLGDWTNSGTTTLVGIALLIGLFLITGSMKYRGLK